jgi:hydrogenase nickel incorporation protein HypA/HybF
MHELAIALSIVDLACEQLPGLGAVRVESVRLRVGVLSGVVKEALTFSFEAAAAGTPLEGARLAIEDVALAVWCPRCRAERVPVQACCRRCPVCDAPAGDVVRGDELEIVALEVTDC